MTTKATDSVPASNAVVDATKTLPTPRSVTFRIEKDCIRKIAIRDDGREIAIYHLYPTLADWAGRQLPDKVNPRSHDEQALKSNVAKKIRETILEVPEDFFLANRGVTILAENLKYDSDKGLVELFISDEEMHGIADGATTDAVLGQAQADIRAGEVKGEDGATIQFDDLKLGRIHLEVILGLTLDDRIARMAEGRNTSRQVTSWSMSDFKGAFNWIKEILGGEGSPFQSRIGYEENADKPVTILDVLGILTLFHKEFDEKRKAPTVAYSSKGRMDTRLNDAKLKQDYRALAPLLQDILNLHDAVHAGFAKAYSDSKDGKAKLGKCTWAERKEHHLPLTGVKVEYAIPSGVVFPLLASLRALVAYDERGQAFWRKNPFKFFEERGGDLVATLVGQLDMCKGNPQTLGKTAAAYMALHDRAKILAMEP